jgi:molybdate-binding protein
MVYALVAEKALPATKVTGKWLFPRHLVEQWIETHTVDYPEAVPSFSSCQGLMIIAGSNDPLLDRTISMFNTCYPDHIAVFGNLGSMGGLKALRQNRCHIASSHLLQKNEIEYNFEFALKELNRHPVIVNFCKREQGILIQKGNPKKIQGVADFGRPDIRIVNRPLSTGTRLLFDRELRKAKINSVGIDGYDHEVNSHLEVGFEILSGCADAGLGIRPVASILDLEFIPMRWERYDFLITKQRFFDPGVQLFLGMLHEKPFLEMAEKHQGYDVALSGKMVFPNETKRE